MLTKYKANHVWVGNKRHYAINNDKYPGVTTVLSATKSIRDKAILNNWRKNNNASIGINRGNEIHKLIELSLLNTPQECSEENNLYWESIKPVLENVDNIQLIEGAVWHPKGFAGSVDCVADYNGQLSIIDWKTSSKPKKEDYILDYKIQTAAYCAAVNRVYNLRICRGVVAIALNGLPAQIFEIEKEEYLIYGDYFKKD